MRTSISTERWGHQLEGRILALLAADPALTGLEAHDLVFLDIETTGLSTGAGTVAFVVGLAQLDGEGNRLGIEQFFLRDFGEEPAVLWAVAQRLQRAGALVTYNGKRFDLPLLQTRFILARQPDPTAGARQVDVLHPVRRLFRLRLESCALSQVETELLRSGRRDDTPGYLMPALFFAYLRDHNPAHLERALEHNRADLSGLAGVLAAVCAHVAAPVGAAADSRDRFALAGFFEARGFLTRALAEYAGLEGEGDLGYRAGLRRARLLRRAGAVDEAVGVLERLRHGHPHPVAAVIELAKLLEHRYQDFPRALWVVGQALEWLWESSTEGARRESWRQDLLRRQDRLSRRAGRLYSANALGPLGGRYGAGLVGTPL
jgi:uncharacterized protein YprB with RNaseH-like and TPR domain